jgi:hypothetical protein
LEKTTMSLGSAKDAALPAFSRRRFAAAFTAAPAALLVTGAIALAAPIDKDEKLFALAQEWTAARALQDEADRQRDEVADRYNRPDEPVEITWTESDCELFGDAVQLREDMDRGIRTGRRFFDGHRTIETLEAVLRELRGLDLPMAASTKVKRGITRVEVILKAHAAWREETRAAWVSSGMEEAERAFDEASARCGDLRWQIILCPAVTVRGVILKAQIASACFGDTPEEIEEKLDEDIDDATGNSMALAVVRDLARIATRGGLPGGAHA